MSFLRKLPYYNMSYRERRHLIKKTLYLFFGLGTGCFIAYALFSDKGILVNRQVKTEYQRLLDEKAELETENARLKREIYQLKHSPRKIEALGRKTFGFARPGEIVFYFPPETEAAIQQYEAITSTQEEARPQPF